jgi:hypothetical protein
MTSWPTNAHCTIKFLTNNYDVSTSTLSHVNCLDDDVEGYKFLYSLISQVLVGIKVHAWLNQ